jgi:hypothetical protein
MDWATCLRIVVFQLRRRDDEAALALAYRGHQVDDARGEVVRLPLEAQALHRVERRQVVEVGPVAALLGLMTVDRLYPDQGRVLLAVAGRTDLADNVVPAPEVEPLYLRGGDVHVALALAVAVRPQKPNPSGNTSRMPLWP